MRSSSLGFITEQAFEPERKMAERHMIIDDTGVLWSDDADDAFATSTAILAEVNRGFVDGYVEHIGETWNGDLVLVKELARTR